MNVSGSFVRGIPGRRLVASHVTNLRLERTGVKPFVLDGKTESALYCIGMALDNKDLIRKALQDAQWVVSYAALSLGCSRQAVYDAMKRHGIARKQPNAAVWRELKRRLGSRGGRPRRVAA